jgi:hypothetical protein
MTITGRLFQAHIWRRYAMMWDTTGIERGWVEQILRVPRKKCLQRARVNLYLAKRLRREIPHLIRPAKGFL